MRHTFEVGISLQVPLSGFSRSDKVGAITRIPLLMTQIMGGKGGQFSDGKLGSFQAEKTDYLTSNLEGR